MGDGWLFDGPVAAQNRETRNTINDYKLMVLIPEAPEISEVAEAATQISRGLESDLGFGKSVSEPESIGIGISIEEPESIGINTNEKTWNGSVDYTSVPEPKNVGSGKPFGRNQLKAAKELNKQQNGGVLKSDIDGSVMNPSKKMEKGVKADMKQVEGDHIKAMSKGGSNSNRNLQLINKEQNLEKGDK